MNRETTRKARLAKVTLLICSTASLALLTTACGRGDDAPAPAALVQTPAPAPAASAPAPAASAPAPAASAPAPAPAASGVPVGLNPGTFPTTPVRVVPGTTAAALGAPSAVKVNGLKTVADTLHRMPLHAVPALWDALPAPMAAANLPSISDIAVLNRRDALIVYLPAVKGAADYRAYIYSGPTAPGVTLSGTQPRGAVVACAGYRQRFFRSVSALGSPAAPRTTSRELMQAIEVPGLVADGVYKVVVEALATPCPFPGVMGHTSVKLPLSPDGNAVLDNTITIRSAADVKALYGNEILNGQGAMLADYTAGIPNQPGAIFGNMGWPVPPNNANAPADPVVLARSAVMVTRPALDEALNGPLFDVGPNSVWDDFAIDGVIPSLRQIHNCGAGLESGGAFDGWYFWTHSSQGALLPGGGTEDCDANPKGAQMWKRHGRLYTTFGDSGQGILGSIYFTSTKTLPQELDATKYTHSFFRVDSSATFRRYWHWFMCGGATRDELVDPVTRIPRVKASAAVAFYDAGGLNPTGAILGEASTQYNNKECLNLIQLGHFGFGLGDTPTQTSTFYDEPHTALHAFISPAGKASGNINLKMANMDANDTGGAGGMPWRMNASRQATGPMFEPFDQMAPLTHFDVFVRPDRVVFYVNGRQAWCADLSSRPLTMKYGLIGYGHVLYHSGAEPWQNYWDNGQGASFQYIMNTPWTDTRVWDAVGHSEKIDIPSQFKFDAGACFAPASTALR